MLFKFLKYISPTNYFNLVRTNGATIFPQWETLPNEIKEQINYDTNFTSETASQMDASWQAIQKGYIGDVNTINFRTDLPIEDEYRFLRKYYNKLWVYYTFVLRLCLLNNPLKELDAILKTRKVKRVALYQNLIEYAEWATFKSKLVKLQPKVSVIIPTLNRYAYLHDVLKDLEAQDYSNFEVIVVDQSAPFQAAFYDNYQLDIKLIHQEEKALWLARNSAIKYSSGEFIALSEDDVRIESNWITQHLRCLDFFKADISAGVFYPKGKTIPSERSFFALSKQFATGNAVLCKNVFKKVGMFDRQFEKGRMGDGEFGLRCYKAGFKSISNPFASCIDVKASEGGLREMGSWDAMRPTNWFAPRPIPSVIYLNRKYFGNSLTRFDLLKNVPPSLIPYQYKGNSKMMVLGYVLAMLIFPLVLFQVFKSWKLATVKLKEGSKIEALLKN